MLQMTRKLISNHLGTLQEWHVCMYIYIYIYILLACYTHLMGLKPTTSPSTQELIQREGALQVRAHSHFEERIYNIMVDFYNKKNTSNKKFFSSVTLTKVTPIYIQWQSMLIDL